MRRLALVVLLLWPTVAAARTGTWTDNSGGVAATEVERAVGPCAQVGSGVPIVFGNIATVAPGVTSFVDNDKLAPGPYCFRARACAVSGDPTYTGCSDYSNLADYSEPSILLPKGPPPAPVALGVVGAWQLCAPENFVCTFDGTRDVRYGDPASNVWVTKTLPSPVQCNNATFNPDPVPGVVKRCEVR